MRHVSDTTVQFLLILLAEATSSCFASHQKVYLFQDPEAWPLVGLEGVHFP